MKLFKANQTGAIPLLVLLAVIGVLIFIAITFALPFKDQLFSARFNKASSYAAGEQKMFFGMFEDANRMNTPAGLEAMIGDLKAHNLDSVMFTNSNNTTHLPILEVSDRLNFSVIWGGPMHELWNNWFNSSVAATAQNAETIIGPLVDQLKNHSSIKAYNLLDDTALSKADKLKLAVDVYKSHDSQHPATAVFVQGHEKAFTISGSDRLLTYYYPAKAVRNACDWNFISPTQNDLSLVIRNVSRYKGQDIPLWTVLQTHGQYLTTTPAANVTALRVPTPEEVSLQHWIALGEGSKGLFWFIYSTQQFWTGLKDAPLLYNIISGLSERTKPLVPTLENLVKTSEYFSVQGPGQRYVSTLVDPSTGVYYVVIANAACSGNQQLTVTSPIFTGGLKDLETGQIVNINTPIDVASGDGKIFQVVNSQVSLPLVTPAPNLFLNPSFETKSGNFAANWGTQSSSSVEGAIFHSGQNSLKLTGATNVYTNQKLNLKPATLYTLSYWIKSPSGMTGNGVTFRAVSTDSLTPVTGISSTTGASFEWKQVRELFYTPTTYVDSRLDLMWDLKAGEIVYIDDVQICEGEDCVPKKATIMLSSSPSPAVSASAAKKIGDIDGNGRIDIFDYNTLITNFGKTGSSVAGDLDSNGKVDIFDYNLLLTNFGK